MNLHADDSAKRLKVVEYEALEMETPPPTTKQLESFVLRHKSMPASFMVGMIICLGVIIYTRFLSLQDLKCPDWALDCDVSRFMEWNTLNIALVQGIATICYGVGLTAMAYAAKGLAEAMIWPLLGDKPMSIEQIESFLSTAHGSVPLHKATIQLFKRTVESALIMALTIMTALTPLAAGPLIGAVYARSDFAHTLHSHYKVGAGIGRIFAQTTPPIAVGAEGLSSFISWSKGLSQEPLPEYRHWVVDRSLLSNLGNVTVNAIYTKLDISCRGFNITPIGPIKDQLATFSTNMAAHNLDGRRWNSSSTVLVRAAKSLSVWVDDFTFNHHNKSTAVIVFAANNGTIEGGIPNNLTADNSQTYPISTLACTVGVEFIDSVLQIGAGGPPPNHTTTEWTTLSSIPRTHISFKNSTTNSSLNTLNENALWFAVAPVLLSPSIGGAQPEYYKDHANENNTWLGLPVPFTKGPYMTSDAIGANDLTADTHASNDWSLSDIHHFINVSIGSVAHASSRNFQEKEPSILASVTLSRRIDPGKVKYLTVPMVLIVAGELGLLFALVRLYAKSGVPVIRMAGIGEVVWACRSELVFGHARETAGSGSDGSYSDSYELGHAQSRSGRVDGEKVMFGWTKNVSGNWVAGLNRDVKRFRD